jgi:hypothetical protein
MKVTAEQLRSLLAYDPETGWLTWRETKGRAMRGAVAGTMAHGYRLIRIQSRRYAAHRLAWLYVYGEWPEADIDHINGDRADNRIANLRKATRAENQQNRAIDHANTSGYPGVTYDKARQKWKAHIRKMNKTVNLGRFESAAEAGRVYLAAKAHLHTFAPMVRV